LPSEGKGHTFESCRARHFGTELGTPKPAVFALSAATSVRRSALFWNGALPPIGYRIVEASEQRGHRTKKTLEIDPVQADG
jgi:hypothetical protein